MIHNRIDFIVERCKDKVVLNLGCVDHDLYTEKMSRGIWLHEQISNVASELIGVDLLEDDLVNIREQGYNVFQDNVESFENKEHYLQEKPDLIVAGEIIEHLFNVGNFLDASRELFGRQTLMLITTPNPFYIDHLLRSIKGVEQCRDDHTCWYSKKTLNNLFRMKDYEIVEFFYYSQKMNLRGIRPSLRRGMFRLSNMLCEGLIYLVRPTIREKNNVHRLRRS